MMTHAIAHCRWSTSSVSTSATPSDRDVSALREHLSLCQGARGRWFTLHCAAATIHHLLAGRIVTTLAVASVLIGVAALLA